MDFALCACADDFLVFTKSEAAAKRVYESLDQWIRRRVRACYWRQWRRPRSQIRKLIQLGVPKLEAIKHGSSSKGLWVKSFSKAVHMALTLDYLKQLGLANLWEIWSKLASKRRIA